MPRFVILRHETPPGYGRPLHWDLMLETGGALRTWALDREPAPPCCVNAELLPDHRLEYLAYEGPVSHNRGAVTQWDHGEYRLLEDSDQRFHVILEGRRVQGVALLEAAQADANDSAQRWTLSLYLM